MQLKIIEISGADLSLVERVYVQIGEMKDPGVTELWQLQFHGAHASGGRAENRQLHLVLDQADQVVLEHIRSLLLESPSLLHAWEHIKRNNWLHQTFTIENR